MDDTVTFEDSLRNYLVKISKKRGIGSDEWKIILPLLKQSVQKEENTYAEEIFSLIMQRPKEYQQRLDRPLSFFYPNMDIEYLAYAYNQSASVEERIRLYTKILDMHEMWITADGMIELPSFFTLKELKEEKNSMDALIDLLYQFLGF